jgi:hypothetical protein
MTAFAAIVALAVTSTFPVASADARAVPQKVRSAAYAAVAKVGRQTHAAGTKLLGCRRSTSARFFCQAQNTFQTGASRCVADVKVTLDRGGRARPKVTSYVCY